jgi:hypothetical protein
LGNSHQFFDFVVIFKTNDISGIVFADINPSALRIGKVANPFEVFYVLVA